jgi:hypothetical protein
MGGVSKYLRPLARSRGDEYKIGEECGSAEVKGNAFSIFGGKI